MFAVIVARMEDTRLPKCGMFGELTDKGRGLRTGAKRRVDGVFTGRFQSFRHQRRSSGRLQLRTRGNGAERWNRGRNISMKARAGLRHNTVVCSNVTGRTKERIAQSKMARVGLLAIVD